MNHSEPIQAIRAGRTRRGPKGREALTSPRVTVSWASRNHDRAPPLAAPSELELSCELGAGPERAWTCAADLGFDWVEALSSARCHEVVLTARLGDNLAAKHLVLDLAERLTFELTEHQPLIRVLFLPSTSARTVRIHA